MALCSGFEGVGFTAYRARMTTMTRRGFTQVCLNDRSFHCCRVV